MVRRQSVLGERMNWINRYVDEPLLDGAAIILKIWHDKTGQRPDTFEPVWHVLVVFLLMIASLQYLTGSMLLLAQGALIMLVLPSGVRLLRMKAPDGRYGPNDFKALRASALDKRQNEWALRMAVLFGSALLPFTHLGDDVSGTYFMLGASLWFVLTAPLRFYLNAAEPPAPNEGDRFARPALGAAT
jgi:hypothetical protein